MKRTRTPLLSILRNVREKKTIYDGTTFIQIARKEKLEDEEVMVKVSETFSDIDALGEGRIDMEGLQRGLQSLGIAIKVSQAKAVMVALGESTIGEDVFLSIFETWWMLRGRGSYLPEAPSGWTTSPSRSGIPKYRAEEDKHCPIANTTKFKQRLRKLEALESTSKKPVHSPNILSPSTSVNSFGSSSPTYNPIPDEASPAHSLADTKSDKVLYPSTTRGVMFQRPDSSKDEEVFEIRVLKLILHREAILEGLKAMLKARSAEAKRLRRRENAKRVAEARREQGNHSVFSLSDSFVDGEQMWAEEDAKLDFGDRHGDSRCIEMLENLKEAALDVAEAIAAWRSKLRAPMPFIYNSKNYLLKMADDTKFLQRDAQLVRAYELHASQRFAESKRRSALASNGARPSSGGDRAITGPSSERVALMRFSFVRNPFLASTGLPRIENMTPRSLRRLKTMVATPSLMPASSSFQDGQSARRGRERPRTTPNPGSRARKREANDARATSKEEAAEQLLLLEEALQESSLYAPSVEPIASLAFESPFRGDLVRPMTSPTDFNKRPEKLPALRNTTPWDTCGEEKRLQAQRLAISERRRDFGTSLRADARAECILRAAMPSGKPPQERSKQRIEAALCLKKLAAMDEDVARCEKYVDLLERDIAARRKNLEKQSLQDTDKILNRQGRSGYIVAISERQIVQLRRIISKLISTKALSKTDVKGAEKDPKAVFRSLDTTHHGLLGSGGMFMAMQQLGITCDPDSVKSMLEIIDADRSGTASIEEFDELIHLIRQCLDQSTMQRRKEELRQRAGLSSQLRVGRTLRLKKQMRELEQRKAELGRKRKKRYEYMNRNSNKFANRALATVKREIGESYVQSFDVSGTVKELMRDARAEVQRTERRISAVSHLERIKCKTKR